MGSRQPTIMAITKLPHQSEAPVGAAPATHEEPTQAPTANSITPAKLEMASADYLRVCQRVERAYPSC
jgi:hypothetical protein